MRHTRPKKVEPPEPCELAYSECCADDRCGQYGTPDCPLEWDRAEAEDTAAADFLEEVERRQDR